MRASVLWIVHIFFFFDFGRFIPKNIFVMIQTISGPKCFNFVYEKYMYLHRFMWLHSCDYQQKISIRINVAIDEGKHPKWNVTLNKRWNWSSCTKLAHSATWTHGLTAQSVRASERNSVVVGSNPTQTNFL